MTKISVIVPVYNVEQYLDQCVVSILRQSFSDFELILINDGSSDQCGNMCDHYAKLDNRVFVIHQNNEGLSSARNAGIDKASGEYITFVDSDDIINMFYLEYLLHFLTNNEADISICGFKKFIDGEIFSSNELRALYKIDSITYSGREAVLNLYGNMIDRINIESWGKLYKKELFEGLRFPVGRRHEDSATTPILLYKSKKVVWFKTPLYGYRQRTQSIMHEKFSIKRYDAIYGMEHCIKFFQNKYELELAEAAFNSKVALVAYYSILSRHNHIYDQLPTKYRMGRFQAEKEMRLRLPRDNYNFRMKQCFPYFFSIINHLKHITKYFNLNRIFIDKRQG